MDSPALPAVLTGALSPAFPVVKTGAAVRFSLRFYAGMARREANGARCEPATGDVRSAQVTGARQEIAGLHTATDTATDRSLYPGNFPPVFFPEFPEKSGRDRLAAYCPHSQPHRRFYPLQIWSGFMPCYQQVENR